jgi:hypothetical protein
LSIVIQQLIKEEFVDHNSLAVFCVAKNFPDVFFLFSSSASPEIRGFARRKIDVVKITLQLPTKTKFELKIVENMRRVHRGI